VVGYELAVQQAEAGRAKPCYEPGECHLGCIALAAEHALAEEGGTQPNAVQATHEPAFVPCLDRMRMASAVQIGIGALDCRVDPGVGPVIGATGAFGDDLGKGLVRGDDESIGADRLGERPRQAETVERQDTAFLRFDPIDVVGRAAVRHREHADRISTEQQVRIDRFHQITLQGRDYIRSDANRKGRPIRRDYPATNYSPLAFSASRSARAASRNWRMQPVWPFDPWGEQLLGSPRRLTMSSVRARSTQL